MEPTLLIAMLLAVLVGVSGAARWRWVDSDSADSPVCCRHGRARRSPRRVHRGHDQCGEHAHPLGQSGAVKWKTGIIFGGSGMVGAFAGGIAGGYISSVVLMLLFAVMMIATSVAMIRGQAC